MKASCRRYLYPSDLFEVREKLALEVISSRGRGTRCFLPLFNPFCISVPLGLCLAPHWTRSGEERKQPDFSSVPIVVQFPLQVCAWKGQYRLQITSCNKIITSILDKNSLLRMSCLCNWNITNKNGIDPCKDQYLVLQQRQQKYQHLQKLSADHYLVQLKVVSVLKLGKFDLNLYNV